MATYNDFVINIATVNGSGSQSANTILLKSLFKMGIPVGGKNVFPSNIAGLPTWFWVRASEKGYTGRREKADIVIAMNPQTLLEDTKTLKSGGIFIYNSDLKLEVAGLRSDIKAIPVPFKLLVDQATTTVKIKKMLTNIIYVGLVAELLAMEDDALYSALSDQFSGKESVLQVNRAALDLGRKFARENLDISSFPFKAKKMNANAGKIILDGNTAGAMGLLYGGATVAAWYPITPSSSVMENFIRYSDMIRTNSDGKKSVAVVQAEDELSSICMVLGAGWAGARSFTATSGPGLSLMQEACGYAYYAEIPSVIWDVQRVGPSTGMPTRNAQGDFFSAVFASHGDTKHVCLIPSGPGECFEFGQTCFDLAERLQTLVIVLSDLDLGMNLWTTEEFQFPQKPFDRGKLISADEIQKAGQYFRYIDKDGDGIPYRAIPGTRSALAGYLTRGSGHTAKGQYTEKGEEYKEVVDRLSIKWETAKKLVPKPVVKGVGHKVGVIAYGSTDAVMDEAMDILQTQSVSLDYMRIRAIPFATEVDHFIACHERVYIIDLNRDGQVFQLLRMDFPQYCTQFRSIRHYDGTPITADVIAAQIMEKEKVTL